jgi:DNA-binding MarR family transcriptional regulator
VCFYAILACVQASAAVSPEQLAVSLAGLWRRLATGGENATYALIAELGLSLTQVKSLGLLDTCAASLSVGEVSERLGISVPAASRTIDGLLRKGWLERHEDEHDRRMKRVSLTAEGRDVAGRIARARMQGLEAFAGSLSDEQRARLQAALEELL